MHVIFLQLVAFVLLITSASINAFQVQSNASNPSKTVEQYLEYTLPPDPIDYQKASAFLASPLREELQGDISFVPRTYGIQDGPDRTAIERLVRIAGNHATVVVHAYYGGAIGRVWTFTLLRRNGQWEITRIQPASAE